MADGKIVYHNYCDVGIAVGGGKGLVVPVLRNAENMSFADIEHAVSDFGRRAQKNQIGLDELEGGTFTITNGGVYGSLLSTPIVNPPQSGVLGMHGIVDRPVAVNGEVVIRPMMYVALTYDHRVVDGKEAVTFLKRIRELIEDPTRLFWKSDFMSDSYDLIVIGAGPGGYVAAIRASQLGMKIAVIERESRLGGTCLRVGCIPSKALLETGELYEQSRLHFAERGLIVDGVSVDLPQHDEAQGLCRRTARRRHSGSAEEEQNRSLSDTDSLPAGEKSALFPEMTGEHSQRKRS